MLDFGLAKAVDEAAGSRLQASGLSHSLGSSGTAVVVTRFAIALRATTSLNLGAAQPVAITRDGRQLVYSARGAITQIYARGFDDLESVPIPGAQGVGLGSIFLSPDSEWIGYVDVASASATFKKIRFDGGQPIMICSIPYLTSFRGAS